MNASTTPFLLSRTLDADDYTVLQPQLAIVGDEWMAGQHPHRRWEKALALLAARRWRERGGYEDLGFERDEVTNPAWEASPGLPLAAIVAAPSILTRAVDPDQLLYHLSCAVAPGGLLVLTFEFWNRCGQDLARNHEFRKRIYCPKLYAALRQQAAALQLTPFGGVDPTWHGPRIHDYSFASLVLEKRR